MSDPTPAQIETAEQLARDVMEVKQIGAIPPTLATVEAVASWLHDRILMMCAAALSTEAQAQRERDAEIVCPAHQSVTQFQMQYRDAILRGAGG